MNNSLLNNLQLYRGRRFSDLVDENMISNALLTKPHEVSGLLSLVFGTKDDGVSTAIDLITGGLGKTMIIENSEFEWAVQIDQEHAINIRWAKGMLQNGTIGEITANNYATATPGANNTAIMLGLEERWLAPGAEPCAVVIL